MAARQCNYQSLNHQQPCMHAPIFFNSFGTSQYIQTVNAYHASLLALLTQQVLIGWLNSFETAGMQCTCVIARYSPCMHAHTCICSPARTYTWWETWLTCWRRCSLWVGCCIRLTSNQCKRTMAGPSNFPCISILYYLCYKTLWWIHNVYTSSSVISLVVERISYYFNL